MPKTIVITRTATGMVRATVSKFAAEGWNVVATVRKEPDLKAHVGLRCAKTALLDVDKGPARQRRLACLRAGDENGVAPEVERLLDSSSPRVKQAVT
jgi:NAD(P)-dependent dehydrogenase (short-subunit alcohol dehydrogenase family)